MNCYEYFLPSHGWNDECFTMTDDPQLLGCHSELGMGEGDMEHHLYLLASQQELCLQGGKKWVIMDSCLELLSSSVG